MNNVILLETLKKRVVESLTSAKDLDEPYVGIGGKVYTKREMAKELEDDTEQGVKVMEDLLKATLTKFKLNK